jgi:hypothetical protein
MTELAVNPKTPLANLDRKAFIAEALNRYEQGELMVDIALSIGLKGAEQIYRLLIAEVPDEWKSYQAARALRRLEDATRQLENAPDALSLARAREQTKAAQWELERLLRRIYGQDVPANLAQAVQININLRGAETVEKP